MGGNGSTGDALLPRVRGVRSLLCQKVPMRDGIELEADVYLPAGRGPFPTVIIRTPYSRVETLRMPVLKERPEQTLVDAFIAHGYALVSQDCRGKFGSDGRFVPLVYDTKDGQDTLDWVAHRPWCNGNVGMWGRSYLGIVQVPAAIGGNEVLKCIVPSVHAANYFTDWLRYDGCFGLANAVRWAYGSANSRVSPSDLVHAMVGRGHGAFWDRLYELGWRMGRDAMKEALGLFPNVLNDWVEHDRYDAYWAAIDQEPMHPKVRVPGLHGAGWFDHISRGQYVAYRNISDHGATVEARAGQRMIVGPWGHTTIGLTGDAHRRYGEWDFGAEADFPVFSYELQFLDYHLRGVDQGFSASPKVKVFLMGENRWIGVDDWPPPDVQPTSWYLNSSGAANTRTRDGRLARGLPAGQATDSYTYDPSNPVPTLGGAIYWGMDDRVGPRDQRPLLSRGDILLYRSEPLRQKLVVIGDINLELFFGTDVQDTDIVAKMCVEETNGAITVLSLGSLRCRYRDSWSEPSPLPRNEATHLRIRMGQLAYVFPVGARIALMITSSDFPRILPHPNTLAPTWSEAPPVVAHHWVSHGAEHPSRLVLPVIV